MWLSLMAYGKTRALPLPMDLTRHNQHFFFFFFLFSGNRQIPGLATGAVGHSLFYSLVLASLISPRQAAQFFDLENLRLARFLKKHSKICRTT